MKTQEMQTLDQAILDGQELISKQAWALHKRIGESYKHRSHSWADMVELGKIAQQLIALENARPE